MVIEVTYPKAQYNRDLLEEELRAIVPNTYAIGNNFTSILIHYPDATSQNDIDICAAQIAAHDHTAKTAEQQQEADSQSILALATTAKNFTSEIKTIWAAVVNADYNADDTATRFTALRAAVAAQGTGFKNALHTALESETGLTTVVLDAAPTANQQQTYNFWIRSFCLTWAFMIVLAT